MKKRACILGVILLSGCSTATQVATTVGVGSGVITPGQKHLIDTTAIHAEKAARPITETEEYYIGRGVAARILSQYPLYGHPGTMRYVNCVGRTLAINSRRPYTYGGYHFAVLDSREINAFACPGGIILVTRGMLDMMSSEDEVAAVIAHEIAHVNVKHGLKAISRARWTQAATALGAAAARAYSGAELASLVTLFEGTVNDVFSTLVVNGYGREDEFEADGLAVGILLRAGYDPMALARVLKALEAKNQSVQGGIFATHPHIGERLASAKGTAAVAEGGLGPPPAARFARFEQASVDWRAAMPEEDVPGSWMRQTPEPADSIGHAAPGEGRSPADSPGSAMPIEAAVTEPGPKWSPSRQLSDEDANVVRIGNSSWMTVSDAMTWDEARKKIFAINKQAGDPSLAWHMPSRDEMATLLATQVTEGSLKDLQGTFWVDEVEQRSVGPLSFHRFCTYVSFDKGRFRQSNESLSQDVHGLILVRPAAR